MVQRLSWQAADLSQVGARTSREATATAPRPINVVIPVRDADRIEDRTRTAAAAQIVAQDAAQIALQGAAQIAAQDAVQIAAQDAAQIVDVAPIDPVVAAAGRTRFAPIGPRRSASRSAPTSS